MKVYLIRHAQSEGNINRNKVGKKEDWNITRKGREQARKLARRLRKLNIEHIYCSNLKRTFQTAKPLLDIKKIEPTKDARLNEYKRGTLKRDWEKSMKLREKIAKKKKINICEVAFPGGESPKEHHIRVNSFMKDLTNKKHKGNVLVFAHGISNRAILREINKTDINAMKNFPQSNTAVNELEWNSKEWKIHKVNSISHLKKPRKAIRIFNRVRDTKYDIFTNNCWDKHFELKKRLRKAKYGVKYSVIEFKWEDQKIPKEILKLPHPKKDYHLYLVVWIHGTPIVLDCTFDKGIPYYNKWNGEEDTKILVKGKRIFSNEKEKLINKAEEEIPKRLKRYHKFYNAINEYWKNKRKES